jgi:uncharacterized protein
MHFVIEQSLYMVHVELVYVCLDKLVVQYHIALADGAHVIDAIQHSGIYNAYPETKGLSVGIYSKVVSFDRVLNEGDRIELYRPLMLDPKDNRRKKARIK